MRFIFLLIFLADIAIFVLFEYSLNTNYYAFNEVVDIDKFRNNFATIASFSILVFFIFQPEKKKKVKQKIPEIVPSISEEGIEEEEPKVKVNKK